MDKCNYYRAMLSLFLFFTAILCLVPFVQAEGSILFGQVQTETFSNERVAAPVSLMQAGSEYDLELVSFRKLERGDNLIHGFAYAYGYIWASTRTSPTRILRFDPQTLEYDRIIMPRGYNMAEDLIAHGGYLWAITYTRPSSIIRINPHNMQWDVPVAFARDELSWGGSLEYADGYLWAGGQGALARINLNNMHYDLFNYAGVQDQIHALVAGGGFLWAAVPRDYTLLRINPSHPSTAQKITESSLFISDDIAFANGHLYVGTEHFPYRLLKVAPDLSYEEVFLPEASYGVFAVQEEIWSTCVGRPGIIARYDRGLNLIEKHRLPDGYNHANELVIGDGYIFVTSWQSPAGILKYRLKAMDWGSEQPLLHAPWEGEHPISQGNNGPSHKGTLAYAIDVLMGIGQHVLAPADGKVIQAGYDFDIIGGSKTVRLLHTGPTGKKYVTSYLHLCRSEDAITVRLGEEVIRGQLIARSGDTGQVSGPHLHFELAEIKDPKDLELINRGDSFNKSLPSIPIERLLMKRTGVDHDFREYNARRGELENSVLLAGYPNNYFKSPQEMVGPPGSILYLQNIHDGRIKAWYMDGRRRAAVDYLEPDRIDPAWQIKAVIDMNDNGHFDIVWQNRNGWLKVWYMDNLERIGVKTIRNPNGEARINPDWDMKAVYDLDGDGHPDIIWQAVSGPFEGQLAIWFMNGMEAVDTGRLIHSTGVARVDPSWQLKAVHDLLGDGKPEVLWQAVGGKHSGQLAYWTLDGYERSGGGRMSHIGGSVYIDPVWRMSSVLDLLDNGTPEILWQRDDGTLAYWIMDGSKRTGGGRLSPDKVDPAWKVMGTAPWEPIFEFFPIW